MHVVSEQMRRDAAGIFLGALLLYIWRLPSHFLAGDGGIYATIFEVGGHGHPPGYPLFSLYLQAWSWLPVESAFWGASFATALLGASAVGLLYVAARLWGAGRFGAAVGAVVFGTAADVWLIHTQPEVFALHHCLMAGVLVLSAPDAEFDEGTILLGLSALGGLGVAHHHTLVLLAPLGLWAGWRAFDRAGRPVGWLAGAVGVFLAAALLPYGYVVWVHLVEVGWHWGTLQGPSDFLHLLLRGDYGTTTLTSGEAEFRPWQQIGYLIFYSAWDLLWLPFAGALTVLGWKLGDDRHWLFLAVSILLAGPVFLALIGRMPVGVDYLHIRKFHIPFELLLTVPLAVGTSRLLEQRLKRRLQAVVLAALIAAGVTTSLDHLKTHQLPTVDQYVRHMLNVVPENAIILGTGDHHFMGTLYMQRTEGIRRDVTYLDATLLATEWYHGRATRRTGASWSFEGETVRTGAVLDALKKTGRPVFLTHVFHDGLLEGRVVEPYGPLIHVVADRKRPPPPREIFGRNRTMLEESEFEPVPWAPPESWAHFVQTDYAEQWRVLSKTLEQNGYTREAARARDVVRLLEGRAD
jgi:hypothetical protein